MVGARIQFLGAPRAGAEFKEQTPGEERPAARARPAAVSRPAAAAPEAPAEAPPAEPAAEGEDNIPF